LLVAQRFLKIDGDFIEDRYVHLCDVIDEGANMLQLVITFGKLDDL
jgi:hypothetical protein